MQVILREDVDHLGYKGDVVDVRKGYWRNYLGPRRLAETATNERVAQLQEQMERRRAAEAQNETEAKELQGLLNRTVLTIPAFAGDKGKLYGSVGPAEIAKALESARKIRVDRRKIELEEPIKAIGTYMVPVQVFAGVKAEIKTIVVEREGDPGPQPEEVIPTEAVAPADIDLPEGSADADADAGSSDDSAAEATGAADAPDTAEATEAGDAPDETADSDTEQ